MALGQQVVNSILADDLKKTNVKHVKGVFSDKRDYALMCRLYYHFKIKGLRYNVAVERLSQELYLGETTIAQIIMKERELLEQLKHVAADRKFFEKKLPWYNWN